MSQDEKKRQAGRTAGQKEQGQQHYTVPLNILTNIPAPTGFLVLICTDIKIQEPNRSVTLHTNLQTPCRTAFIGFKNKANNW